MMSRWQMSPSFFLSLSNLDLFLQYHMRSVLCAGATNEWRNSEKLNGGTGIRCKSQHQVSRGWRVALWKVPIFTVNNTSYSPLALTGNLRSFWTSVPQCLTVWFHLQYHLMEWPTFLRESHQNAFKSPVVSSILVAFPTASDQWCFRTFRSFSVVKLMAMM